MQQKLYGQIPLFLNVLKASPMPLDLHIAVVTTDMGAPGDLAGMLGFCTAAGDDGAFRSAPTGTCTNTTLATGATYLTDDGRGTTNFTGSIADVLQCIFLVGHSGCGFGQPLAAAEHALGADHVVGGVPTPPSANAGFLRPDAALAIVFLANQDDCSAPAGTQIFSLGGDQNLTNPLSTTVATSSDISVRILRWARRT
jgi:membrane-associated protease RseP (regulator of RpoE activity)